MKFPFPQSRWSVFVLRDGVWQCVVHRHPNTLLTPGRLSAGAMLFGALPPGRHPYHIIGIGSGGDPTNIQVDLGVHKPLWISDANHNPLRALGRVGFPTNPLATIPTGRIEITAEFQSTDLGLAVAPDGNKQLREAALYNEEVYGNALYRTVYPTALLLNDANGIRIVVDLDI